MVNREGEVITKTYQINSRGGAKQMKVFELIFIILVIIVIAVLFLHPHFQQMKTKSYTAITRMEPVRTAIRRYISDTGKLPSRLEDLIACPEGLENSWRGPYLTEQQLYDQWKNKYRFDYGYRLQSLGADGIKGGTGKNADSEQFIGLVKNENKGDS
jgi:general secretion pathway protein G